MNFPESLPKVSAPSGMMSSVKSAATTVISSTTGAAKSAVSDKISSMVPSVKSPTIPSASSLTKSIVPKVALPANPTSKLASLTRGSLPEPKLGMAGLQSSPLGAVDIKGSMIGKMTPSLAGMKLKIPGADLLASVQGKVAAAKDVASSAMNSATEAVELVKGAAGEAVSSAKSEVAGTISSVRGKVTAAKDVATSNLPTLKSINSQYL